MQLAKTPSIFQLPFLSPHSVAILSSADEHFSIVFHSVVECFLRETNLGGDECQGSTIIPVFSRRGEVDPPGMLRLSQRGESSVTPGQDLPVHFEVQLSERLKTSVFIR